MVEHAGQTNSNAETSSQSSGEKHEDLKVALRDAERTMHAIRKGGFTGEAGGSWRLAKAWLDKHAKTLAALAESAS